MLNINEINKVYLIGIGGIGVSAIAKLFLHHKKQVTGSDVYQTDITRDLKKRKVKIYKQHEAENITEDIDLVVYSPAVTEDNPEYLRAQELNIELLSYPEVLGALSRDKNTIVISGTNGKSTTAAMIGKIFEAAGLDPTVIVGTQVPGFDGNLRIGKSNLFIVEGCEWKAHMLNLSPDSIILTNLAEDHLDFYKDMEDIKYHFQKFVDLLPLKGFLGFNADDINLQSLTKEKGYQIKSWGIFNNNADYIINVETQDFASPKSKDQRYQIFNVNDIEYKLKIPGLYNIYNAVSAICLANYFEIPPAIIKKALKEFPNCWRRFEITGKIKKKGAIVISDYAHHPHSLKGVIKAAKSFYPERRLVVVFQPHHYDRTYKLFDEFVKSFSQADAVILNEVYDVAGRQKDGQRDIGSEKLAGEIKKISPNKEIIYSPNLEQTKKTILNKVQNNDLVLIIGAGDIDEVARQIAN